MSISTVCIYHNDPKPKMAHNSCALHPQPAAAVILPSPDLLWEATTTKTNSRHLMCFFRQLLFCLCVHRPWGLLTLFADISMKKPIREPSSPLCPQVFLFPPTLPLPPLDIQVRSSATAEALKSNRFTFHPGAAGVAEQGGSAGPATWRHAPGTWKERTLRWYLAARWAKRPVNLTVCFISSKVWSCLLGGRRGSCKAKKKTTHTPQTPMA